jgi:putative membrane protein insertion efficiency factor
MRQLAKLAALQILQAYKWAISPMLPPSCRFVPTCSEYAMEAVDRYGVLRGGLMALWRLLRCHPLAHGGYDPVVKEAPHAVEARPAASARNTPAASSVSSSTVSCSTLSWSRLSYSRAPWKSGASAPRQPSAVTGFSPRGRLSQYLKRNA